LAAAGKSFRAAVWVPGAQVEKAGKVQLLRNYISKQNTDGSAEVQIDPRWYQVRGSSSISSAFQQPGMPGVASNCGSSNASFACHVLCICILPACLSAVQGMCACCS
jgi:hypothetical protein